MLTVIDFCVKYNKYKKGFRRETQSSKAVLYEKFISLFSVK